MSPLACHCTHPAPPCDSDRTMTPMRRGSTARSAVGRLQAALWGIITAIWARLHRYWRRRGLIITQAWTGWVYYDILLRGGPGGARIWRPRGWAHTRGDSRMWGVPCGAGRFPWAQDTPAGGSVTGSRATVTGPPSGAHISPLAAILDSFTFQTFSIPLPFSDDVDYWCIVLPAILLYLDTCLTLLCLLLLRYLYVLMFYSEDRFV